MKDQVRPRKSLVINPIKVSRRVGATLAFLGLDRSLPLEHGVRGCTAFTKLFFMRHFREPIPLQTTAVDEITTVLGGQDNVVEGLRTVIEKNRPSIVGVTTTTMAEFQGADLGRALAQFRAEHPEHAATPIVPVIAGDETDGLETGYASAVEALLESLVVPGKRAGSRRSQLNVLAPSMLTPGDIEALKSWIQAFGLQPVVLPDLGDSLDGHLLDEGFSPVTHGGTTRAQIERLGQAAATLTIGSSLEHAAEVLQAKTGVPDYRCSSLLGLEACDELTALLSQISGCPVPERIERQRSRLLDAMVDCQFQTADTSAAVAGDPDLVATLARFLTSVGVRVAVAVAAAEGPALHDLPVDRLLIGDLDDLERDARACQVDLVLANSHAAPVAARLGVPLLRVGYPQHDFYGAHAKIWTGYGGSRQILFDVANALAQVHTGPRPFTSMYRAGANNSGEVDRTPSATRSEDLEGTNA